MHSPRISFLILYYPSNNPLLIECYISYINLPFTSNKFFTYFLSKLTLPTLRDILYYVMVLTFGGLTMKRFYQLLFSAVLIILFISLLPLTVIPDVPTAECSYRDESICVISRFVQLVENSLIPKPTSSQEFSYQLSSRPIARLFFYMLLLIIQFYISSFQYRHTRQSVKRLSLFDFNINHPMLAPPV